MADAEIDIHTGIMEKTLAYQRYFHLLFSFKGYGAALVFCTPTPTGIPLAKFLKVFF